MIDHVDVDLRSFLLGVRDQAARPTCLAHAVSAAHEHVLGSRAYLSPEYLHFFANVGGQFGNSMRGTANALEDEGQSEEAQCSYFSGGPPAGWKPPKGLQLFRRASEPKSADIAAVEHWIRAERVPVIGISIPEPFFHPRPPWIISSNGQVRGLHAVASVGMGTHRGNRVFLIRNSWGTDWGDAGHAWIDDAFLARHLREVLLLTHEVSS